MDQGGFWYQSLQSFEGRPEELEKTEQGLRIKKAFGTNRCKVPAAFNPYYFFPCNMALPVVLHFSFSVVGTCIAPHCLWLCFFPTLWLVPALLLLLKMFPLAWGKVCEIVLLTILPSVLARKHLLVLSVIARKVSNGRRLIPSLTVLPSVRARMACKGSRP